MKENIKLSFLWVAIVAGMSSHSLMDVMPLFWNADIAISKDGVVPVSMLVMMAVVSYTLPITGLLLSLYAVKLQDGTFLSCSTSCPILYGT